MKIFQDENIRASSSERSHREDTRGYSGGGSRHEQLRVYTGHQGSRMENFRSNSGQNLRPQHENLRDISQDVSSSMRQSPDFPIKILGELYDVNHRLRCSQFFTFLVTFRVLLRSSRI